MAPGAHRGSDPADLELMGRLGAHTAAFAVLLVAILAVIPIDSSFSTDDGAYGGAVHARRHGSWVLERPLPVVAAANEGWFNSAITPSGPVPYSAKPSYVVALQSLVRVVHGPPQPGERGGDVALGLAVLPALGALASAVLAWLVAARWDRRAAPLAFWLVGLGPTIVNATTLWGHTLATALGGLGLLGAVQLLPHPATTSHEATGPSGGPGANDRPALQTMALALLTVLGLAGSTAVRNEALLWVVAVVIMMVAIGRSIPVVATAALAAVSAGGVWLADRRWGAGIRAERLEMETVVDQLRGDSSWLASRIPAAWQLLLTSFGGPGPVLSTVGLVLAVAGALRLRTDHDDRPGRLLLLAAAAVYLARLAVAPSEPISGLLGAWPVLPVLLLGSRWSPRRLAPLLVPAALITAAVLLTQYASSGGLQWGGRYLSVGFVAAGAAAAIAGRSLAERCPGPLLALAIVPAVVGLGVSYRLHDTHRDGVDAVTVVPSEVVITEIPALPPIGWTALPTSFYLAGPESVEQLLAQLAGAGVATVNVQGLDGTELDGVAGYQVVDDRGAIRVLQQPDAEGRGE